ncbi:hypothetical protein G4B88_018300 [Cannabis sativa]|uniref:Uncharacterized protein n=1 Tax=Cannabis sativa TaxID=3483 RepID=A0A7J6F5W5_CANSA|nr:hypothetical protein G4B88_018300 [Cannabis sativa]
MPQFSGMVLFFKNLLLITSRPHIFSNGYQIRFNEEPCSQLGYIVPEWLDKNPTLHELKQIYGSGSGSSSSSNSGFGCLRSFEMV